MTAQLSNRDYENLSAYLDGQLAPGDQRKLEQRLKTRPELQQALEDMTRTRALLRSAPRRRAPRNFTLTPAMVGERRPRGASWFSGLFPTLSFASALAALALVLSLVFELLPGPSFQTAAAPVNDTAMTQQDSARAMEAAPQEAAPQEAAPQEEAAPAAAAEEMPAAEAPQEPGMGIMEAAPAEESAPAGDMAAAPEGEMKAAPPVAGIVESPGVGGGDAAGIYSAPPGGYGMGGGGDGVMMDSKGFSQQWTLPLESVQSLDPQGFQQRSPREMLREPASQITGTGPILGVPAPQNSGQVQVQSGWGLPLEAINDAPSAAPSDSMAEGPSAPSLFGLSGLRLVQALLAVLAVGLGVAAYAAYRRTRRA